MTRLTRKSPLLILAAIVLAAAVSVPLGPLANRGAAAASGRTINFSGQVVNASAFSGHFFGPSGPPPGTVDVGVSVFQSGAENNRQAMLNYDVCMWKLDPDFNFWYCALLEGGFGLIPGSAVQSSGGARPNSVSLKIDTSTLSAPDFRRFAGSGGLISLTWSPAPGFTDDRSGSDHYSSTFGGQSFSYSTSGSSYATSAVAQGTVIGNSVPDPTAEFNSGNMGSMQGMSACRGCGP